MNWCEIIYIQETEKNILIPSRFKIQSTNNNKKKNLPSEQAGRRMLARNAIKTRTFDFMSCLGTMHTGYENTDDK